MKPANQPVTLTNDLADAIDIWHALARRFCAVQVTLADCGCFTVEYFAGGRKVVEEDKDLLAAMRQAVEATNET